MSALHIGGSGLALAVVAVGGPLVAVGLLVRAVWGERGVKVFGLALLAAFFIVPLVMHWLFVGNKPRC